MKKSAFITILSSLLLPTLAYAQYVPIVNIPGITGTPDINSYINALYILAITVAALLAVIKIIIAGVKWMTTDIVTSKGEAKKDIQGALVGLLVIMGAVLIIEVINPDIGTVDLNFEDVTTPEPLPGEEPTSTPFEEACADEDGGGCEVRRCDSLDDYTWDLVVAGAAVGTVVPGIGTLSGAVVGGLAGWSVRLAGNEAECQAVCAWLSGEISENSSGDRVCVHPVDADAFRAAEIAANLESLREEYDCTDPGDRLITSGSGEHNCIDAISETEQNQIVDSIGITVSDEMRDSILQRIESSEMNDIMIFDSAEINNYSEEIGAEQVMILVEAPTNSASAEYEEIYNQVEGICNDLAAETGNEYIGIVGDVSGYIACAR